MKPMTPEMLNLTCWECKKEFQSPKKLSYCPDCFEKRQKDKNIEVIRCKVCAKIIWETGMKGDDGRLIRKPEKPWEFICCSECRRFKFMGDSIEGLKNTIETIKTKGV